MDHASFAIACALRCDARFVVAELKVRRSTVVRKLTLCVIGRRWKKYRITYILFNYIFSLLNALVGGGGEITRTGAVYEHSRNRI